MYELFDTRELLAAERLREIDAAQIPGQITIDEAIAEIEQEATGEPAEPVPVMPAPVGVLWTADEVRGQLVLA